jgi:hypothetical protein
MTTHILTPPAVEIPLPQVTRSRSRRTRTIRIRPEARRLPRENSIDMSWALYRLAPRA